VAEGFTITVPRGPMICGYCGETEFFGPGGAHLTIGYLTLTGFHMLGVHRETGELVVLAEATWPDGRVDYLSHLCEAIPAEVRAEYAADIAAVLAAGKRGPDGSH
jgi:hypothetical protein